MMSKSQIHIQPSIKEDQTFRSNDPLKILTWLRMKLNNLIHFFWLSAFVFVYVDSHNFTREEKNEIKYNFTQRNKCVLKNIEDTA